MSYPPVPQQPAPQHPPQTGGPAYPPASQPGYPAAPTPPGYGATPAQPGYPAPSAPPARRGNPAGLVAAILVGASLALQLIQSVSMAAMFASPDFDPSFYGVVAAVFSVFQGLLAVAAVVLGAIGLAAGRRPKALSGIGLGGGAVVLFGILSGFLSTALIGAFA